MKDIYENYLETSAVGTEESAWKIEEIKVNYSPTKMHLVLNKK